MGIGDIGRGIRKATQTIGLSADPTAGQESMQASAAIIAAAQARLEAVGVPSIEAQKIALTSPELVLSTPEEQLGTSAFQEIALDPRLQEAQMQSLAGIQEIAETGVSPEDRARMDAFRQQVQADEASRRASILSSMMERGALDSGSQLAAQLASSQAATELAHDAAMRESADIAAAKRAALGQQVQMAGQIGSQQFQQQAAKASAADQIARFNAAVAGQDTAARRAYAQQIADIKNRQEMHNKALIQQDFQNRLAKAQGSTQIAGQAANQMQNQAQMQAHGAQQAAAGTRQLLIGGIQAGAASRASRPSSTPPKNPGDTADGGVKYADGSEERSFLDDLVATLRRYEQQKQEFKDSLPVKEAFRTTDKWSPEWAARMKAGDQDRWHREGNLDYKTGQYIKGGANPDYMPSKYKKMVETEGSEVAPATSAPAVDWRAIQELDKISKLELPPFQAAHGGYKKMGYEEGGMTEGRIVPGDNFAGDEIPDRINSGEMVLNLDQQDRLNDLLQELAMLRGPERSEEAMMETEEAVPFQDLPTELRADEMVDNGEAGLDETQQEALMSVLRGESEPEMLLEGQDIVEPIDELTEPSEASESLSDLEALLGKFEAANGGTKYQAGGLAPYKFVGPLAEGTVHLEDLALDPYKDPEDMSELPYADAPTDERTREIEEILGQITPEDLQAEARRMQVVDPSESLADLQRADRQSLENLTTSIGNLPVDDRDPTHPERLSEQVVDPIQGPNQPIVEKPESKREPTQMPDEITKEDFDFISERYPMFSGGDRDEYRQEVQDVDREILDQTAKKMFKTQEKANKLFDKERKLKSAVKLQKGTVKDDQIKGKTVEETKENIKKVESDKKEITNAIVKSISSDEELERARMGDFAINILNVIDRALAHYDAANVNATLKPIFGEKASANLVKTLLARRKEENKEKRELRKVEDREYRTRLQEAKIDEMRLNNERKDIIAKMKLAQGDEKLRLKERKDLLDAQIRQTSNDIRLYTAKLGYSKHRETLGFKQAQEARKAQEFAQTMDYKHSVLDETKFKNRNQYNLAVKKFNENVRQFDKKHYLNEIKTANDSKRVEISKELADIKAGHLALGQFKEANRVDEFAKKHKLNTAKFKKQSEQFAQTLEFNKSKFREGLTQRKQEFDQKFGLDQKQFEQRKKEHLDKMDVAITKNKQAIENLKLRRASFEDQKAYRSELIKLKEVQADLTMKRFKLSEMKRDDAKKENIVRFGRNLIQQNPLFKTKMEQAQELADIQRLINSVAKGNEGALNALGIKVAKAYGEKGVLTDADVNRYIKGVSLFRRMAIAWKKSADGTLPKEHLKELKQTIKQFSRDADRALDDIYKNTSGAIKKVYGEDIDPTLIDGILAKPAFVKKASKKTGTVRIRMIRSDGSKSAPRTITKEGLEKLQSNPRFKGKIEVL